ncbi:MAG: hypothetical protein ACJ79L_10135 [Anaeromyxobacteraceae bacterium]
MTAERQIVLGRTDPPFPCPDCGAPAVVARGGVREGGKDLAMYLAARVDGHRPLALAISWGRWGPATVPGDRVLVSLLARVEEEGAFEFMVVDAERTPFEADAVLGQALSRPEALAHPDIERIFLVGQDVLNDDPRVAAWLEGTRLQ